MEMVIAHATTRTARINFFIIVSFERIAGHGTTNSTSKNEICSIWNFKSTWPAPAWLQEQIARMHLPHAISHFPDAWAAQNIRMRYD
jgi:hypothetical protein